MSKREKFHVVPKDRGQWGVKKEGAGRSLKTFDDKKDAIDYGRDRAKEAPKGQLIILKKDDGIIQTEYNYKKVR